MAGRSEAVAAEAFEALRDGRQIAPFSARDTGFTLDDAHGAAARLRAMRVAQSWRPVGRKIGFTNRAVQETYGISGPIWSVVYDTTVRRLGADTVSLAKLCEPRIEPEIVLHLADAPNAEMDDAALLGCVDWVAHGFEIVHSIYPGWKFAAADAVAAGGLHGALLIGEPHAITDDRAGWAVALAGFEIALSRNGEVVERGHARNVLGGPVQALRHLVRELAARPESERLRAGEMVTTGTLTAAPPAVAGDTWTTALSGIAVDGIAVRFT